jgi:imidazolonepropionase-like amidohydrolase
MNRTFRQTATLAAALWAMAMPSMAAPMLADAPVVLHARYLFDGISGQLSDDAVVVVEHGRITGVGPQAHIPQDAVRIDLGNATLAPGFIDAHVHLGDEDSGNSYKDFYEGMLRLPAEEAFYAERNGRVTLEAGFTTVRVVGTNDWVDLALRNAIDAGLVVGPRIIAAAHALGTPGGHCDAPPFPPERVTPQSEIDGICSGPESCRAAVRAQMKWGADVIKICASGGVFSESDPLKVPQLTVAELEAIIGEAHRWGRKVAAHAHGDEAARLAVEAGIDSIEHGTFLSVDTLRLMKQKGVYLVPTRMAAWWATEHADGYPAPIAKKARSIGIAHREMFQQAVRIGVPIAFGTDSGVSPHGQNAHEFSLMVEAGMSPSAALLSATRDAARLLGIDQDTGSIAPGHSADLVAVPGNVLEHIDATEHPTFVMARGRVVFQQRD